VSSQHDTFDPKLAPPQDQGAVATFVSSLQYRTHPAGDAGAETDLRTSLQRLGRSDPYIDSAVQYGRQLAQSHPIR